MKIVHWNYFKPADNISGSKRYEDELYNNINNIYKTKRIYRIKRNHILDYSHFKTYNADIVHATFQALAPLKIINNPKNFVLTVHDIIPKFYFNITQKIKNMWYLTEFCIPKANAIITDSKFTKSELIKYLHIDDKKIHVIPLGVDHNTFFPMEKELCKKRFNLNLDKKHILINSSNEKWKNMKMVNEIINELGHEYQFVKIGYGDTLNDPKVINLGYIEESYMPILYNACDLLLHTSLLEGFGLPILEAQACGCPVVCSNSSSLPEIVKDGGFLVNNREEYIEHIRFIFNNSSVNNYMRKKGIENAKTYTWKRTANETINTYKELIGEK
jgi:glycosyltransferase involved in cell wall biosynthesis